ncbi:sulfurtransferase TusA family protein [Sedimentibacter sp. MB31-C6]|uniref:sulfurtransferase TusA family protein n=1 Tax=Sedimentibacter sp. MB31-C6 TaxID=3109366 RepID=UPI002DDDA8A5|nr:sulfurtransferase TusA family protein [Sedimentibacter sp. MB36-C1]WSI04576.1 sulfurtransferase TusA family protein [Sedimentibacter sp. MB36-C1]
MKIDTCGTSCPQPVLMTKNCLKKNPDEIEVIVDNNTSKTNVKKYLISQGYSVDIDTQEDISIVKGQK